MYSYYSVSTIGFRTTTDEIVHVSSTIVVKPRWFLVSSSAGVCMSLVWKQVRRFIFASDGDLFRCLFECGGDYLSTYFACRCL